MSARQDIADAVTGMLHAIDALDWPAAQAHLADQVTLDYTSLFGGAVETIDGAAVVDRWRGLLPGFDATQHLTGPVVTTELGDREARCRTTVRGYHVFTEDGVTRRWMVAGNYDMRLLRDADRWRISAITLTVIDEEGDRGLVERATARAAANEGVRSR